MKSQPPAHTAIYCQVWAMLRHQPAVVSRPGRACSLWKEREAQPRFITIQLQRTSSQPPGQPAPLSPVIENNDIC
jgi:hypothetical protein